MADVNNFSTGFRRAVAWTVCYGFIMWAILRGLFNFNMFSLAHWAKMAHVELHGFPGFVFGILMLAAVPLYIATTIFTYRKETPIRIPLPKCFEPVPKPAPEPVKPLVTEQEVLEELPVGVPAEMREIFMRAHKNRGVHQMSVFNRPSKFEDSPVASTVKNTSSVEPMMATVSTEKSVAPKVVEPVTEESSAFPIPTDFDTPPVREDVDVPVFSEIKFDDDDDDEEESVDVKDSPSYAKVQEVLSGAGYKTEIVGNLIVVDNFAIAVHDDDDFWVADEIDWFAAGRQKPSPIVELTNIAKEKELKPIMYLGQSNIMDLDKVSEQWRASGIEIVTNTDDLLKLIQDSKK